MTTPGPIRYYAVIREVLGGVIVLMTKGYDEDYARYVASSIFKNASGKYFVFEITQETYDKNTYCRATRIGKFEYSSGPAGMILKGEEEVFIVATGTLSLDHIIKDRKENSNA